MKALVAILLTNCFTLMSAFQASNFRVASRTIRFFTNARSHGAHCPKTSQYRQSPGSWLPLSSLRLGNYADTKLFSSGTEQVEETASERLDYTTTRYISERDEDEFFSDAERDEDRIKYPKGTPEGFYVIKQYSVPPEGFESLLANGDGKITQEEINRLNIDAHNITLPIALMLLDEEAYPSFSRARKSCRKGYIIVHRGPLKIDEETGEQTFDTDKCFRGRVPDRVYPGDVIGYQVRLHGGFYPGFQTQKPAFDLPVIYEDDHFAIVNKPAGVVCYSQRKQGHGLMTVRAALPFVLKPPKRGTLAIIRRPVSVHRLDKPTSGLLLCAKTKPAMVELTRQFVDRRIKKTYTAIVNGIPDEPTETSISSTDALNLGVDVDTTEACQWQKIENVIDEKVHTTVWKPLETIKSLKANNETLTLVELKPKTGRYHQLRRHMSWVCDCPIVGDSTYDGGGDAMTLRGRGLFLCSNKVSLEHPYYNTEVGRLEWDALPEDKKYANGVIRLSQDGKVVEVHASIDLPEKFQSFLRNEGNRYEKFSGEPENDDEI